VKAHAPFLAAVLLTGCFGARQAVEVWLALAGDAAECYSRYADCIRLSDGDQDAVEACVIAYEGCYETAADAAKEADGEDGCITAALVAKNEESRLEIAERTRAQATLRGAVQELTSTNDTLQRLLRGRLTISVHRSLPSQATPSCSIRSRNPAWARSASAGSAGSTTASGT